MILKKLALIIVESFMVQFVYIAFVRLKTKTNHILSEVLKCCITLAPVCNILAEMFTAVSRKPRLFMILTIN